MESHRWSGHRAGRRDGAWEVLVDDWSRHVKASLAADPREFYAPAVA